MLLQLHHLYHIQVIETYGQSQSGEQHSAEQQAVLVGRVVRVDVVEVEDTDTEYCEVGADT